MNRDSVATFYFCRKTNNVPVGKANTTVARGAADGIGIVCPVDTDSLLVKRNPYHSDRIIRTGWEKVEIAAAFAVLKHFLVPTKRRHLRNPAYFPLANGRCGVSGTDRDRISRNSFIAFVHLEHVGLGINFHRDRWR